MLNYSAREVIQHIGMMRRISLEEHLDNDDQERLQQQTCNGATGYEVLRYVKYVSTRSTCLPAVLSYVMHSPALVNSAILQCWKHACNDSLLLGHVH